MMKKMQSTISKKTTLRLIQTIRLKIKILTVVMTIKTMTSLTWMILKMNSRIFLTMLKMTSLQEGSYQVVAPRQEEAELLQKTMKITLIETSGSSSSRPLYQS